MSRKLATGVAVAVAFLFLMLAAMVFVSSETTEEEDCSPETVVAGSVGLTLADGERLIVGSSRIRPKQMQNAAIIVAVGRTRGLSDRDIVIALMVAIQESRIRVLSYGDRDSLGIFQQRPSQGWGTPEQVKDPVYASNKFFDVLETVSARESMSLLDVALAVQRPSREAYLSTSNYFPGWEDQALKLLAAASGLDSSQISSVQLSDECEEIDPLEEMVLAALSRQGDVYDWDDSSGGELVSWAAGQAGITLPASLSQLETYNGSKSQGVEVKTLRPEDIQTADSLQRGDIVFTSDDADDAAENVSIELGPGTAGAGSEFRIATYNITVKAQFANYPQVVENIKRKYKLDIVGTQELEGENYRFIQREMKRDGAFGIYPDKKLGEAIVRHGLNARAILYRSDRFVLDESRSRFFRYPRYPDDRAVRSGTEEILAGQANAPVAYLTDKVTGQDVIVVNFHNVAFARYAERRYRSNLILVEQVTQLRADYPGIPIFLTGDFNEGTGVRDANDGANYTYQQRSENLLYCMFANSKLMVSTEAESRNQATSCPNQQDGGVDYIYATPDIRVAPRSFTEIARGLSGSDHPAKFVDVVVPGAELVGSASIPAEKLSTTVGRSKNLVDLVNIDTRRIVKVLRLSFTGTLAADGWQFPLKKGSYTYRADSYGPRSLNGDDYHNGTDFGSNGAEPPLVAMHSGKIVAWGYAGAWGNHVVVETGVPVRDSPGETYKYLYAHLSTYAPGLTGGDEVAVGQLVGYVGNTGNSFGEHLHLTICTTMECVSGNAAGSTDPIPFLADVGIVP